MTDKQLKRIRKAGLAADDFAKKTIQKTVNISREEYNLLDATEYGTIYYIAEPDGSINIIKGENI